MEFLKEIAKLASELGLGPGVVVGLVAMGIMYRLLLAKDAVIEKLAEAIGNHSTVMTEIKTLLSVFMQGGRQ